MENKIKNFFVDIINIRDGTEQNKKIVDGVKENITFRGANFWLLIFAVLIASIGLNINSAAVIVGAMLISPLMGPIVGIGLSLGINDTDLFRRSMKNLLIATVVGILVSALYFTLSPIDNVQSELLARTSPTVYDVLIALFGGFVGIVGLTRKERGNAIPGVAIATALMPPLCTVGYGIATAEPHFIFGALYLFTINSVFICLATLLGVKYLRIPKVEYLTPERAARMKKLFSAISVIMLLPAVYLAYGLVKENNFHQNVSRYINDLFVTSGYSIIYKNIDYKSTPQKIELAFLVKRFSPEEIANLESLLVAYGLAEAKLDIKQGDAFLTEKQWNEALSKIEDETQKARAIEARLASGFASSETATQILNEAHFLNEKIVNVAIGTLSLPEPAQESYPIVPPLHENAPVILMYTAVDGEPLSAEEEADLIEWARIRMLNNDILVYFF